MQFFREKIFRIVRQIPKGKTLTYKEVAKLAGHPKAYRAVGNILHSNRDFRGVPCHRVIRSNGQIGGYVLGAEEKQRLLEKEGLKHRC